ncbi:MAG: hypothetical protein ACRCV9_03515 [Burkholderiaceae bacterium]
MATKHHIFAALAAATILSACGGSSAPDLSPVPAAKAQSVPALPSKLHDIATTLRTKPVDGDPYEYLIGDTSIVINRDTPAGVGKDALNGGYRTDLPAIYIQGTHANYGDKGAIVVQSRIKPHPQAARNRDWLDSNSIVGLTVGLLHDGPRTYSQTAESASIDNGYQDTSAVAFNSRLIRTSRPDADTIKTLWANYLASCWEGTRTCDAAYMVHGKYKSGVDLAQADLDERQAAIVLRKGQRIYFDADRVFPARGHASGLTQDLASRAYVTMDEDGFISFGNVRGLRVNGRAL